jgi:hypothetical protein
MAAWRSSLAFLAKCLENIVVDVIAKCIMALTVGAAASDLLRGKASVDLGPMGASVFFASAFVLVVRYFISRRANQIPSVPEERMRFATQKRTYRQTRLSFGIRRVFKFSIERTVHRGSIRIDAANLNLSKDAVKAEDRQNAA